MGLTPAVDDSAPQRQRHGEHHCPRAGQCRRTHHPALRPHGHRRPDGGDGPVLRDGVITSNGETVLGADDKAGIAIILAALSELLTDNTPHGPIEVVFSVQEEVGLFGASYLNASR